LCCAASLDVAWSEANENIVASCGGDGSVKLWDVSPPFKANPLRHFDAHAREAVSLDWNVNHTQLFLSSSWDDTIKLWNAVEGSCVNTFTRHSYCVYSVKWWVLGAARLLSC
jgi:peroxin-7